MAAPTQISVTVMLGASIISRIRKAASRFAGANQGNIAVIFAIALVPVISFVGAAIDYSRANSARSSMQAALDSTALMLSKDLSSGTITTSQITAKAQAYFTALYTNTDAKSVVVNATYTASNGNLGSTIQVSGSGSVTTDFMKVAGFPNINFNTSSTTAWGNVRMRVAMALDNTGSMADDGKITALRTAVDQPDHPAQRARQESRRRLYFDHSVRQGRQRRLQQLHPDLDRLDRLAKPADAAAGARNPADLAEQLVLRSDRARPARSPTAAAASFARSARSTAARMPPPFRRAAPIPAISARASTPIRIPSIMAAGTASHPPRRQYFAPAHPAAAAAPTAPAPAAAAAAARSCKQSTYNAQLGRQRPKHVDRLHHRPHAALRRPEHGADDRQHRRRCSRPTSITRTARLTAIPTTRAAAAHRAPELQLDRAESHDRRDAADRRHQPGRRNGLGMGIASAERADERAGGRSQLHLQQRDHPVVRRSEYRRPLAGQRQRQHAIQWLDRRPPGAAVPEHQGMVDPKTNGRCTRSIRSR